jgi:Ca2+-binding RTX toxin-like protein
VGNFDARSVIAIDRNVLVNNNGNMTATSVVATLGNVTINNGLTLFVDRISAINGSVTIVSGLSVVDVDGDDTSDIDALTISITVANGTIGETFDDLEINTTDSIASSFTAQANKDIFVSETSGRLNLNRVASTAGGNIRLATNETSATGENINAIVGSVLSTTGGWLMLLSGDDVDLTGSVSAKALYVYGDYRNRDSSGSNVSINGALTTESAEITTDVDDDVIVIAATMAIGFVIRVGKGDDRVNAGSGFDQLYGGPGRDKLYGGAGNDLLEGGGGIGDELYGEAGNDRIFGSDDGSESDPDFADNVRFGDVIDGGDGDDVVNSLGGADLVMGGAGIDVIDGGLGSDRIFGNDGNDSIYTGAGLGDWVDGGNDNDFIVGSNVGNDSLFGSAGNDKIYGQAGNDTIDGGLGEDFIDGGAGIDTLGGGVGDDEILAGIGVGDRLYGDDGDDVLRGADDGADFIYGGLGRDRIFGNRGNDTIEGGAGDDTIEGGAGDDLIYGDGGSDVLIGGTGHDILYALNFANSGIDNSVDYLYGDLGTNNNESDSGNDKLYGAAGRDLLFGEGGDDQIDDDGATPELPAIGASLDTIDYGANEGVNPLDYVAPTPTPPPALQANPPAFVYGATNLPTGIDDFGRWGELSGSASGLGLTSATGLALSPSVASTVSSQYVTWSDSRSGNLEVYVAEHAANQWRELNGSAGLVGLSNSVGASTSPNIAIVGGKPTVAWTEQTGASTDIRLAQFDSAANSWNALGDSLSAAGLSSTGSADSAVVIDTSFGPVVVFSTSVSGTRQVYVRLFNGTAWGELGNASDSGTGLSGSAVGSDLQDITVATRSGRVAVAWTAKDANGIRQVVLKQFDGTAWQSQPVSAVSLFDAPITANASPSLAYFGNDLFVAWQTYAGMFTLSTAWVVALLTNLPTHTVPDLMQIFDFGRENLSCIAPNTQCTDTLRHGRLRGSSFANHMAVFGEFVFTQNLHDVSSILSRNLDDHAQFFIEQGLQGEFFAACTDLLNPIFGVTMVCATV